VCRSAPEAGCGQVRIGERCLDAVGIEIDAGGERVRAADVDRREGVTHPSFAYAGTCDDSRMQTPPPDLTAQAWVPGDQLPTHNDGCMVCGRESVSSPLLAPFTVRAGGEVGTRVRFDDRHQGAPLYAHGGMVAAALDDACGYVSFLILQLFVTAHLEVDYRRPVVLGIEYDLRARCSEVDGRKVHLAAELADGAGIVAECRGLFVTVDLEHFRP
jgi:acyl-coenzyme A thioesterase PaaI-like protein